MTAAALRVAARFHAAVAPEPGSRLLYPDDGVITAAAVTRVLAPAHGPVFNVRFRPASEPDPNGVAFEGLAEDGTVIVLAARTPSPAARREAARWARERGVEINAQPAALPREGAAGS